MSQSSHNTKPQTAAEDVRLRIDGMDCAEEVTILKRELVPLVVDAERLQFDVLNRKLTVRQGTPKFHHGNHHRRETTPA